MEKKHETHDTLQQLYRRINAYAEVLDETIKVYNKISADGRPFGKHKIYRNEVQDLKRKELKTFDLISAFDKIAEVKDVVDSYSTMTLTEVKDDEILF